MKLKERILSKRELIMALGNGCILGAILTIPIIEVKQIAELNEIAKEYNLSEIQTNAFVNFMVRYDPSGNVDYAREQADRIFTSEYTYDEEWQDLLDKCFWVFDATRKPIVPSIAQYTQEVETDE